MLRSCSARSAAAPGRSTRAEADRPSLPMVLNEPTNGSVTLGPLPDNAVLRANAGLILEPDLYRLFLGQMVDIDAQDVGEVF